MKANPISIESSYDVYDNDEGVKITVCGDADALGIVRVTNADDEKSVEWFGKIDFTMSPKIAEGVAKAILKKVQDIKENEKP